MSEAFGRVLMGDEQRVRRLYDQWSAQPVDEERLQPAGECTARQTTIRRSVSVTGPGTFFGRAQRTLTFQPAERGGWRFDRTDVVNSLPIDVAVKHVWTTARNIVLASGSPHNYMRMVEHIVALKVGLGLDHVLISMDSGDPPLFERSSMDLVDALGHAGTESLDKPARYWTVKEPVTAAEPRGGFLTFMPAEGGSRSIEVDCAINFRSSIGKQRIRFIVNRETFEYGASARTNTTFGMMLFVKTIGQLFADTRNLGYSPRNILIAGRRRYFNKPTHKHNNKYLEAAWHRATLDLLAAVALIDRGRFAGKIISYKSGHALDVEMVKALTHRDLLDEIVQA